MHPSTSSGCVQPALRSESGVCSSPTGIPTMTQRRTKEKLIYSLLWLSALAVVLPVLLVVYFLAARGAGAMTWTFLTRAPEDGMRAGGIMPAIVGTVYLIAGTALFALPVGVLSAVYLTEYARPGRFTRMVRLAIVNLSGVPSVVFGLFGLAVFVTILRFGVSVLAGSLTLALMALPVVITASEEALLSVPGSFREASLALGATKLQTVRRVVLPNAVPGILTGLILALSRAAGETAPILFTAAAFYLPRLPRSVFDSCMALPYHLYVIATQVPNAPERVQWGTSLTLLLIVLGMSAFAAVVRTRFRRARKW